MIKRQDGFTLVELLVTMVVFVLVMGAATGIFSGLLTQFKQQSKIAETSIEGVIGLEMLRQDLEHAGYGLPWNGLINYTESAANPFGLNDAPTGAPRGIISENKASFSAPNDIFNDSDYLVVRSVNIARNEASRKWTYLREAPFTAPYNPRSWTPATENLAGSDRVIVLVTGTNDTNARTLISNGAAFHTTFSNVTAAPWPPTDRTETRVVYGINTSTENAPQRPFNRADYFISSTDEGGNNIVPSRCSPNTGVLVKATMHHDAAGTYSYLPLLDCVADMQVIFGLDNDDDGDFEPGVGGSTDVYSEDISALTAQQTRNRVRQVRVYILAHEGQKDPAYVYPNNSITVGEFGLERVYDLTNFTDWQNYRWKLYTLVVQPKNLR